MGEQANTLAARFEAVNREVISLTESLSEEQWQQILPGEDWPIGVAAHHIAVSHPSIADWAVRLAHEKPVRVSHDQINDINSQHAAGRENYTKEDTLKLLEANGKYAAEAIRQLEDDQLDNSAPFLPAGEGKRRSCRQIIEFVLIDHPAEHLKNMRQALGVDESLGRNAV